MQSKKRIGEKEFSGKQLKQLEQEENYLKKAVEYSKGKNWGIGDIPKEFDSIISIDIFFNILLQAGIDNPQGVLRLLSAWKGITNANIKNPLKRDNKELNEYFFAKLEEAEKLFSLAPPRESELKKASPPQQTTNESETIRYTAKHYVLAYLIECNAKGESFPIGQKKELEKIGNRIMGRGKGNRFYKVFNEIVNKDLNAETNLIEIGGENWRTIVKGLSSEPETIETYLQNKQL